MRTSVFSLWVLLLGCAHGSGSSPGSETTPEPTGVSPVPAFLSDAVASPARSAEFRARDRYRHPVETLQFLGLERGMRVLELWPGRGWYTEVLAPALVERGALTVATTDPESEGYRGKLAREMVAWFREHPERFGQVRSVMLSAPDKTELGEPESYDMVVTFRNSHNWINDGVEREVYRAVYEVLAPGGIFGVVQHRAQAGADPKASAKKGYVPEDYLIAVAEELGFELEARSEVNANPADTKDYAEGVWALPPALRGSEASRAKAMEIGESDRMTLRFRKPSAACVKCAATKAAKKLSNEN